MSMENAATAAERTISVAELRSRLQSAPPILLDVREYPEYAEGHVKGARLAPLGELRRNLALAGEKREVLLLCRTGGRARQAAALLRDRGRWSPVVVEGGVEAWKQAGYPLQRERGPIALERQVRILAGALALTGLLVPRLGFLAYLVGAGLIFAGVTNSCAMGLLLARLPWNRPKRRAIAGAR
jgi:rhodanese-related sulfurtransferase